MSAGTTMPLCSVQPHRLCAQSSSTCGAGVRAPRARRNASTATPAIRPNTIFSPTIFTRRPIGIFFETSTGINSSEVERNTATSVPTVITPPA